MTQLVLHTGTPMTRGREVQARLIGWREPLAQAGVILLPQDRPDAWDRTVRQLVTGDSPQQVRKLVRQSVKYGAKTVLLCSGEAFRPLRKGKNLKQLIAFRESSDVSLKVVLVLREQLDMLNAWYCQQVQSWETFADFEPFVTKAVNSGLYHYAQAFRALLDTEEAELVAVPFSRLATGDPARTLLLDAGVDPAVVGSLPDSTAPEAGERPLGPVLLAATRLTHKRLARVGLSPMRGDGVPYQALGRLRTRADAGGWDDETFWGWTPGQATAVATSYRHNNAEFAAGAWRADWPDPVPVQTHTKPDLASREPALVVDVMDAIQRAVDDVMSRSGKGKQGKRAATPEQE